MLFRSDHLTSAASSLLQAATGILAAVSEQSGAAGGASASGGAGTSGSARPGGVERIDLDEPDQPDHDGPPSP